jgi:hypothetical protein
MLKKGVFLQKISVLLRIKKTWKRIARLKPIFSLFFIVEERRYKKRIKSRFNFTVIEGVVILPKMTIRVENNAKAKI